jgi:hypothetical protein
MPKTKEVTNWTGWKDLIEGWTRQIVEDWDKSNNFSEEQKITSDGEPVENISEEIEDALQTLLLDRPIVLASIKCIGRNFKNFNEENIELDLYALVLKHIMRLSKFYGEDDYAPNFQTLPEWKRLELHFSPIDTDATFGLSRFVELAIEDYLSVCKGTSSLYLIYYYLKALTREQQKILMALLYEEKEAA